LASELYGGATVFLDRKEAKVQELINERSRSRVRSVVVDGVSKPVRQWSRETGIHHATILRRLDVYGWSEKDAIKASL
jgi:hypothetical protein